MVSTMSATLPGPPHLLAQAVDVRLAAVELLAHGAVGGLRVCKDQEGSADAVLSSLAAWAVCVDIRLGGRRKRHSGTVAFGPDCLPSSTSTGTAVHLQGRNSAAPGKLRLLPEGQPQGVRKLSAPIPMTSPPGPASCAPVVFFQVPLQGCQPTLASCAAFCACCSAASL